MDNTQTEFVDSINQLIQKTDKMVKLACRPGTSEVLREQVLQQVMKNIKFLERVLDTIENKL